MKIAIVKYNAGNTASVGNALRRLGVEPAITDDAEILGSADKVIFPGVGEASTAMAYLRTRKLDGVIRSLKQPVLGICLGMHLMCRTSEENETQCLDIFPQRVRRFSPGDLKVPHMGWNRIGSMRSELFKNIDDGSHVYFVHGFYVETGINTTAECVYGDVFSAAMEFENFHAAQFHPEKSGGTGQRILENFLNI